ncbi:MAG: S8 family serine peptidase [Candidatus Cybelea sp.]
MNRSLKFAAPLVLAFAFAGCNAGGMSSVPAQGGQSVAPTSQLTPAESLQGRRACPGSRTGGQMQCDAIIEREGVISPDVAGWAPTNFQARYKLPITKGAGQIVAIVDAFDNPNVTSDLAAFRTEFGLGTANFTKYNQTGQVGNYPVGNAGWGAEIDLDVEMVSSSCPLCTIYLIEANDNYTNNLDAAEKEAVKLGATIVTNSFSGGGGSASGGAFDAPGVTYLASAGDGGYGLGDPADYTTVVSVGGTLLSHAGSPPVYAEAVWPLSGGGCSVVSKPSWQHDPKCNKRTGNDTAAVAAGVAFYDTYQSHGWGTIGGTSVSSPLVAGMYALKGNSTQQTGGKNIWTLSKKKNKRDFNYISTGKINGCPASLQGTYLCQAGTNQFGRYSGPDGWGTPKGVGGL